MEKEHGRLPDLRIGDIVMIRHKKNWFRYFLRRTLESYWDHTAMVIYPADAEKRIEEPIIVESIRSDFVTFISKRGVAIHRLGKYLAHPNKYEIGIKRVRDLTDDELSRVRSFMLMNVDAPYWYWRHAAIILAAFSPTYRKKLLRRQRFSCSGLIQKAYYDAVDWNEKYRVVFKSGPWSPLELQELTSPADIARHRGSDWVYNKQEYGS